MFCNIGLKDKRVYNIVTLTNSNNVIHLRSDRQR